MTELCKHCKSTSTNMRAVDGFITNNAAESERGRLRLMHGVTAHILLLEHFAKHVQVSRGLEEYSKQSTHELAH